ICPTCRERLSSNVWEPHAKETKNCDESDHNEEEKEKGGHAEWELITPEHLSRLRPRPETSDKPPDDIPPLPEKAFKDSTRLQQMGTKLVDVGLDSDLVKSLKTKLKDGRNYLKGDFKVLNMSNPEGRFSDRGFKTVKPKKLSTSSSSSDSSGGTKRDVGASDGTDASISAEDVVEVDNDMEDSFSDGETAVKSPPPSLFACPNEGCTRSFQRYSSMVNHVSYGKCKYKEERETLLDKANIGYKDRLVVGQSTSNVAGIHDTGYQRCNNSLASEEGWALRKKKKAKPFTGRRNWKKVRSRNSEQSDEAGHR
ncbi:hypothetical protein QZH41_015295, partial [Actinostola sp. cb2023]